MKKIRYCRSDKVFYTISGIFLALLLLLVAYPLIYVLSASFSSGNAVSAGRVVLWPVDFSLEGYKAVFNKSDIWPAYLNTILYTVVGTFINVAMVMIAAYPLSRSDLKGRNVVMVLFTFTMFFGGGMIPFYILLTQLHMIDTFWVMVVPGALSVYNMIIARTFIQNIPTDLEEAAKIDGCSDARYFVSIVIPLSKAVISVLALYYAVGHWNSYMDALLYMLDTKKYPLQLLIRGILLKNATAQMDNMTEEMYQQMKNMADLLKYALIIVSSLPVLIIYPFAKKYFMKGVMIGAVKG